MLALRAQVDVAMRHPLEAIPAGKRRYAFVPLLLVTLIASTVLRVVDRPITNPAVPYGIVSFEVAGDAATARRMIDSWDAHARIYAGFSLGFDYLFMLLYSTTIALACLWAKDVFRATPHLVTLGKLLAWLQWLAALLDGSENAALTTLLVGGVRDPWPAIAWWSAVPKFVLITAGILYTIAAALRRLVRRP